MNKDNAQRQGRKRGAQYLRNHGMADTTRDAYMNEGLLIAQYEIHDLQIEHLFMCGWEESWKAWTPPRRVYPHNPNSRFCACPDCMAG